MFLLGHWKNYDDLEESLSLDELMATLNASREKEYRHNKFMAALKGIDLDEDKRQESLKRVQEEMERLEAEKEGQAPSPRKESNDLSAFGIAVMEEF